MGRILFLCTEYFNSCWSSTRLLAIGLLSLLYRVQSACTILRRGSFTGLVLLRPGQMD
jgi:hypothetical protein